MKLRLWLLAMDATCLLFGFGSRPYLWALGKASDATDWGDVDDDEDDDREVPF